jgi:hypothetical protein
MKYQLKAGGCSSSLIYIYYFKVKKNIRVKMDNIRLIE